MVNERETAHPSTSSSTSDSETPAAIEAVVESSAPGAQASENQHQSGLEKYCEENPSASPCLIYEE